MNNRVLSNASWIIACKVIQSLLALVIGMLTARYLGPSNYGTINYAASLVTFAMPIMQLGINSILVREIVVSPEREGEILGTTFVLCFGSAIACMLGIIAFTFVANAGEQETIIICAMYSVVLVFHSLELLQYWFQAKLLSKYTSLVMLGAYLCVAAYRIFLLVTKKSIYWFAISACLDTALIALSLLVIYWRLGGQKLSFSKSRAKSLTASGKYFIVSSLMITIFSQTDKVMLKLMIDERATGIYAAAVACALLSNFVFTAIMDSARPTIFEHKKNDPAQYEKRVIQLFAIIVFLSLAQSVAMTLLAHWIVLILYGEAFIEAAGVLQTVVWYTAFSYIGAVRSIWLLAEGKQKYLVLINAIGAALNVVLNYFMIGWWGVSGAAIATLVTQAATNLLVPQLVPDIRSSNLLLLRSLHPKWIIEICGSILRRKKESV